MFEDFTSETVDTGEAMIRVRHGGSGPPLLLLHGYPQTHAMWHRIAPRLARDYTVVAMDLRGYGDTSKPPPTADHEPYSKRALARDAVAVMRHLGFERFDVAGHDRGGRVAYRLALDHPQRVRKLATLDILPTSEHFRRADMKFGLGYWHWFFLAQPYPLPEKMIGSDPGWFLTARPNRANVHSPEALAEYLRCFTPESIHAQCEDYRAGATYDFALDEADRGKKKIAAPLLALWAARGQVGDWYDVLGVWRDWSGDVRGHAIDAGHFMAEEAPDETYAALHGFFAET
ncbi:MAG: alpha/beta hydrolase [Candidatus Eremiobacteraeota bacterium]|nr:alpha/beta hydrolase [Candidatus Eremiobacteraeota bacterium]